MSETAAALALMALPGMTPAKLRMCWRTAGGFDALLDEVTPALPASLQSLLADAHNRPDRYREQGARRLEDLVEQGIDVLVLGDEDYPALLGEIPQSPPVLYVRGSRACLALPQLAIVGGRRASRGGLELASAFAAELAASGFIITSGLALGIDGAAHRGALRSGRTVAVVGTGLDTVYPRQHRTLQEQILAEGGAVVSELPPGAGVRPQHFPARNRIISGMSLGVLVIEAALRSGSLITARLALEQGREVFAIPGSIHSAQVKGCHQLIREGALLTESAADIVEQLGGLLGYKAAEMSAVGDDTGSLGPEARQLLELIGFDPVDMDTLAMQSGMAMPALSALLVSLEIEGRVEARDGRYLRLR